jgi:hypothetical protein
MIIKCPYCKQFIFIEQLNCGIFRCGVYKNNFECIPAHLPKNECDELFKNGLIYGCSKPFQIINNKVVKCDYI